MLALKRASTSVNTALTPENLGARIGTEKNNEMRVQDAIYILMPLHVIGVLSKVCQLLSWHSRIEVLFAS